MMRRFIIIFLVAVTISISSKAEIGDTLTTYHQLGWVQSQSVGYRGSVWNNPANYKYYLPFNYTDLKVYGEGFKKGNAALIQEGNTSLGWGADANTFMRLSKKESVYGSASYSNVHIKNIVWNENTDYEMLYPYVVGDSLGGFMQNETYSFMGGYSREFNRFTAGIQMSYRAVSSARDKDPRPYNIVSDLNIGIGGAYTLGKYRLAIGGDMQSYKQKGTISYFADKGSTAVYQMLGFGLDYVRFGGSYTKVQYKSTRWGGNISIMPTDNLNGVSASFVAHSLRLTKELISANNLPLTEIQEINLQGDLTYMNRLSGNRVWGINLSTNYNNRKGIENIVGDPTGFNYDIMGHTPGYQSKIWKGHFDLLLEHLLTSSAQWGWNIRPTLEYNKFNSEYSTIGRSFKFRNLLTMLNTSLMHPLKSVLFTASASAGYLSNIHSDIVLNGLNTSASIGSTLAADYLYLGDSYWIENISLRADFAVLKKGTVYLATKWQFRNYKKCDKTYQGEVTVGLTF